LNNPRFATEFRRVGLRRAASDEARRVRAAQEQPARRLSTSTASAQARDADPI